MYFRKNSAKTIQAEIFVNLCKIDFKSKGEKVVGSDETIQFFY